MHLADKVCGGRLAVALEGGYGALFGESVAVMVASLAEREYRVTEVSTVSNEVIHRKVDKLIREMKDLLHPYWSL